VSALHDITGYALNVTRSTGLVIEGFTLSTLVANVASKWGSEGGNETETHERDCLSLNFVQQHDIEQVLFTHFKQEKSNTHDIEGKGQFWSQSRDKTRTRALEA
jgi:hypothetical protein